MQCVAIGMHISQFVPGTTTILNCIFSGYIKLLFTDTSSLLNHKPEFHDGNKKKACLSSVHLHFIYGKYQHCVFSKCEACW